MPDDKPSIVIHLRESEEEPVVTTEVIPDPEASITAALRLQETSSIVKFIEENGKKKAIYRVIQAGWSGNGFYYSKDVTPQLVPFIESKPMFFADHIEPMKKKDMIFGHQLKDAVAVAEKVWATDDGQVLAKLAPVGNPSTQWIWEAAQAHPEFIGNSIDAYGKVTKGEAEGRKGNIVASFVGYDSTDFVYRPAAGGKFMSVTEAQQVTSFVDTISGDGTGVALPSITTSEGITTGGVTLPFDFGYTDSSFSPTYSIGNDNYSLEEAARTLKDVMKRHQKKSLFWNIGYILTDFIYAVSVDRNMSDEEKSKAVTAAVKDFTESLKEIDPITLFNESLIEGETIKPLDKLKNKLEDNSMKNELIEALKAFTPAELLESAPDLYNKIVDASATDKEVAEALGKLPTLKKDNEELLEKVETLSTEKKTAEDALKEAQDKLKKYEEAEEKAAWSATVDELIKESKIDNALITDTFKGTLMESKDEERVKTLLDDRKGLKTEVKPDFDNPKPTEDNTQEQKAVIPSKEDLARAIKAPR
jgi:hypothetical protein